jgi:hypothetical protein
MIFPSFITTALGMSQAHQGVAMDMIFGWRASALLTHLKLHQRRNDICKLYQYDSSFPGMCEKYFHSTVLEGDNIIKWLSKSKTQKQASVHSRKHLCHCQFVLGSLSHYLSSLQFFFSIFSITVFATFLPPNCRPHRSRRYKFCRRQLGNTSS